MGKLNTEVLVENYDKILAKEMEEFEKKQEVLKEEKVKLDRKQIVENLKKTIKAKRKLKEDAEKVAKLKEEKAKAEKLEAMKLNETKKSEILKKIQERKKNDILKKIEERKLKAELAERKSLNEKRSYSKDPRVGMLIESVDNKKKYQIIKEDIEYYYLKQLSKDAKNFRIKKDKLEV